MESIRWTDRLLLLYQSESLPIYTYLLLTVKRFTTTLWPLNEIYYLPKKSNPTTNRSSTASKSLRSQLAWASIFHIGLWRITALIIPIFWLNFQTCASANFLSKSVIKLSFDGIEASDVVNISVDIVKKTASRIRPINKMLRRLLNTNFPALLMCVNI